MSFRKKLPTHVFMIWKGEERLPFLFEHNIINGNELFKTSFTSRSVKWTDGTKKKKKKRHETIKTHCRDARNNSLDQGDKR